MTMTDVRTPERSSAAGPSLVEALERPRYEILPLDGIADDVLEHLPAGRKVTVTSSPSRGSRPRSAWPSSSRRAATRSSRTWRLG